MGPENICGSTGNERGVFHGRGPIRSQVLRGKAGFAANINVPSSGRFGSANTVSDLRSEPLDHGSATIYGYSSVGKAGASMRCRKGLILLASREAEEVDHSARSLVRPRVRWPLHGWRIPGGEGTVERCADCYSEATAVKIIDVNR